MSGGEGTTTRHTFDVPSDADPELAQIALLIAVLDRLQPVERGRVLRYLTARFSEADSV